MKRIINNFLILCVLVISLDGCSGNSQSSDVTTEVLTFGRGDTVAFKKHTLTREFVSEGVAVGDINHDGKVDVMAGAYWFEAPDWKRHEIFSGKAFDPAKEYSNSFVNFSMDVNQDEWIDFILIDFPGKVAWWYENPKNENGHWKKHIIHETVEVGNESPGFVDVDGDGRLDILCADSKEKQMVWLRAPLEKGTTGWTKFTIVKKILLGQTGFRMVLDLAILIRTEERM